MIDLYSVKPVDEETLRRRRRTGGPIVTVEDHWPEGGLGEAVLAALADLDERPRVVTKLAVQRAAAAPASRPSCSRPRASTPQHIAEAARALVRARAAAAH